MLKFKSCSSQFVFVQSKIERNGRGLGHKQVDILIHHSVRATFFPHFHLSALHLGTLLWPQPLPQTFPIMVYPQCISLDIYCNYQLSWHQSDFNVICYYSGRKQIILSLKTVVCFLCEGWDPDSSLLLKDGSAWLGENETLIIKSRNQSLWCLLRWKFVDESLSWWKFVSIMSWHPVWFIKWSYT